MNQITIEDISPRGQLMLLKESKDYTLNRINDLKREGKIDLEFAKQLREDWCNDTA